jgi:hypothetical protein
MKINLLLNPANRSWIIQKIAEQLGDQLRRHGAEVSITDVPDAQADLVHHMSWAFANIRTPQPSTMFITHLDDLFKLNQVRAMLAAEVRVGICMSSDTMRQLITHGCPETALHFISPAHDGLVAPRRIVIGITSRVYADGRKREALLQQVAQRMDLSNFEFRIFGLGWEATNTKLEAAGAKVTYFGETDDFRKDYDTLQSTVPTFDHYLYLGMDEGSLGTLDALAAGVSTIITPQGFHLDLPGGITHPVVTADDLERVFTAIAAPARARAASVAGLTWATYARRHLALWTAIVEGSVLPRLPDAVEGAAAGHAATQQLRQRSVVANALSPRRLLSAVSHWPGLRGARRMIDRMRLRR